MIREAFDRWPVAAGLLAAPFYLALISILGAAEPGYSHRTEMMSLLGGVPGPRGLAFNTGVAATGLLVLVFAMGLRRQLPGSAPTTLGCALMAVGGLGLIGAATFPCNEGCRNILAEPDLVGRLHMATSFVAGMGTAVAPFFIWVSMRRDLKRWSDTTAPTLGAAILANLPGITLWITLFSGRRLYAIEGLLQRMGFLVVLIWIFFVAARLRRKSRAGSAA